MAKKPNRYTSKEAKQAGYASGLEYRVSTQLQMMDRDFEYESESCTFDYYTLVTKGGVVTENGEDLELPKKAKVVQHRRYTCDFKILTSKGEPIFIETKGYFKPKDRVKHIMLKKLYPDADIRIVFQSNGKVSSKTSYAQWAEKNGIRYYCLSSNDRKEGVIIPIEWLSE